MTRAINILIFAAVLYLQASFIPRFDVFGAAPNIILILMLTFALFRKNYEAYIFAFLSGLFLDTISAGPFGLHTATFMLMAFIASLIFDKDKAEITNLFSVIFMIVTTTLFYVMLFLFVSFQSKNFTAGGLIYLSEEVGITMLFFIIFFPILRKLFTWENKLEKIKGK